ncbi:MAG TPA: hypothetical protein VLJ61_03845 [Pyrinomonadaceae bacterium]|nr:hypothetical protein [Pyrinomonadaceae bacterium]
MRDKNTSRKSFLKIAVLAAFVVSLAATARAQIDPIKQITEMSAVGVARGQVARLNVFYHDLLPPGPCAQDGACKPPESFDALLTFYSGDGSVSIQRKVTLTPDKGGSLVFTPTGFGADGRVAVRAEVSVEPDASGYQPRIIPSVEVMDAATGLTGVLNPGSLVGFNPQPEPPGDFSFGLFNVVKGQTARVNTSFVDMPDGFPPGPCRLVISFYDGDGRLIGQSFQSLEPGKTAQFDYSTAELPAGARQRIRASVHIETADGTLIPCVMPSLEIFAADTGRSALFIPGRMMGSD